MPLIINRARPRRITKLFKKPRFKGLHLLFDPRLHQHHPGLRQFVINLFHPSSFPPPLHPGEPKPPGAIREEVCARHYFTQYLVCNQHLYAQDNFCQKSSLPTGFCFNGISYGNDCPVVLAVVFSFGNSANQHLTLIKHIDYRFNRIIPAIYNRV